MNSVHFTVAQLERFCRDIFRKFGFSDEDAARITDVLLLADLYGVRSHGTQRLVRYYKSIVRGSIDIKARPEIVFETPVSAVIDGHMGMGQVISAFAMKKAIEKARENGIAFVTVRNSNHYGIAGYYAKMACDEGMIGICVTNSESIMVHTGSRQAVLGSNPIAFAMPAEPCPFWFDAATTVVPRGKLEVYKKAGKHLQEGWTIDEDGDACYDPAHAIGCIERKNGGGILPVGGAQEASGGHKGYGFSMICELLCAITSGGATSNHHVRAEGQGAGTCHAFIVIDPRIFGDPQAQKERLSVFLQELRSSARVDEDMPIYTHGEKEMLSLSRHLKEGIDVDPYTFAEMLSICDCLGMDADEYLGQELACQ